jgi:plastocyanin
MKMLINSLCFIFLFLSSKDCLAEKGILEVSISIKDHKFYPDLIEVPEGQKIRLTVNNLDNTIEEFDSIDLKREKIILGNSFAHIMLAPLKPGRYYYVGEFHADTAKGCIVVNKINN